MTIGCIFWRTTGGRKFPPNGNNGTVRRVIPGVGPRKYLLLNALHKIMNLPWPLFQRIDMGPNVEGRIRLRRQIAHWLSKIFLTKLADGDHRFCLSSIPDTCK